MKEHRHRLAVQAVALGDLIVAPRQPAARHQRAVVAPQGADEDGTGSGRGRSRSPASETARRRPDRSPPKRRAALAFGVRRHEHVRRWPRSGGLVRAARRERVAPAAATRAPRPIRPGPRTASTRRYRSPRSTPAGSRAESRPSAEPAWPISARSLAARRVAEARVDDQLGHRSGSPRRARCAPTRDRAPTAARRGSSSARGPGSAILASMKYNARLRSLRRSWLIGGLPGGDRRRSVV